MKLTEIGESRIRGYLFVLERSLRTFLPRDVAQDAVREVESHIRERIEQLEPPTDGRSQMVQAPSDGEAAAPAERAVVERVLAELGPPLRVAQAYSHEMTLDEAVTTGRFVPVARALLHGAMTSVIGSAWATAALCGYVGALALVAIAVLKPIFPNNVGLIVHQGSSPGLHLIDLPLFTLGAQFPLPPGAHVYGGYWIIPFSLAAAVVVFVFTHRLTRRVLAWMRSRRPPARLRLQVDVVDRTS